VLGFVGVALVAEAVFAAVVLLAERSDVAGLASTRHAATSSAVISALEDAYKANDGWPGADFKPVTALAEASGAAVVVEAEAGATVLRTGPSGLLGGHGATHKTVALDVDGRTVGRLRVGFPPSGLTPGDQRLRSELVGAVGLSAGLAAGVAVVVGLVAAGNLERPIRRLSRAAAALGSGIKGVRVGPPRGPVELGELARAFDSMAASLERQEELRQAMVADVAHELRTPVAILQAETELLMDGSSELTPQAVMSLHDECLRLGRMVQDLQTLASADAAGLRLERSRVDLALVAASTADSYESQFAASGVNLERDLGPAEVWADASRLRQVVANLLSNAAKFTPAGGSVRLLVHAEEGQARLVVTDTGPGVPPAERAQLFERFFRGGAGRRAGGSGIGLAVVRDLVEAHGGEVHLESSERGGASFVVSLPLAPGPDSPR